MKFTAILPFIFIWAAPLAYAAGPVETNPYAMQGVEVDESEVSAKLAKDKALVDVQVKALQQLGQALGGAGVSAELAKLEPKQVMPLLKSLSIEKELISPGHYKGTFTVRFLPNRLKPMLANLGVKIPDEQGPAMLVIPVWTDERGQVVVWEDNPWRKAWISLHAAQAQIPLIVPLGDQEDASTLSSQDVMSNNAIKIEAMRRRYDVKTLLLAFAQAAPDNGVHVHVTGTSPLGKITIDKIYTADTHTLTDSTTLGAQRFQQLITDKFRSDQARSAAKAVAAPQALVVTIPFAGPSEWNGLRSRILSTPGVVGLDVTSLDGQGAAARLLYSGNVDDLGNSLQATGLKLARSGVAWLVVPL